MLCNKFAKISENVLKTIYLSYGSAIVVITASSIYELISTGDIVPPVRICITCFLEQSVLDYAFELTINILLGCLCICVVSTFDTLIYLIIINMFMVSSIITGQLQDLKEAMLDSDNTPVNIKYRFRAIILMILKYNKWVYFSYVTLIRSDQFWLSLFEIGFYCHFRNIEKFNRSFYNICLAQILLAYFFVIMGAFLIVTASKL